MLVRATITLLFFVAYAVAQSAPADLIIFNANIRTMDKANPMAEAIAVANGSIIAVGTSKTIQVLADPGTKVIDAGGKLLLPGFNDAHMHFMAVGNLFSSLDLSTAMTADDVIAKFTHFAKFLPKGRWILGSRLDPAIELSLAKVDAVTPSNPVFIYHSDPASAFANSLAMGNTQARAANGVVTGKDLQAIAASVPINHIRDWPAIAETASNYAASFGITSITDTHSDDMATVYRDLSRQGRLKTRIYDCVALSNWAKLAAIGIRAADGDPMVRRGCVKGFYDPDDEETASLARNIKGADKAGLQVAIHAIGKEANAAVLDAFEKAIAANGPRDRRFRTEHAHDLRPVDLERFSRSKIIPSMQPILFFNEGPGTTDDYRKMLDSGASLAFGADAPMRGIDPIEGIYDAVNAGGKRGITVEQAVYAYTMGAAFAEFQEKKKGSIQVGKVADLIILSDDIFAEKADIRAANVTLAFVNGKIVYENK